ncbi:hypothetical protein GUJ93_ZPchr0014g47269 [Zizania palustris]|uniref:Uncharacterized protein n=1 Tax=Zizania palustris TaxID=103762 RepID=A0A8J5T7Q6_ZIZPA|nr:hypothetical protein GUJ93_ZPchr0014g47269 [Zizania palustris]
MASGAEPKVGVGVLRNPLQKKLVIIVNFSPFVHSLRFNLVYRLKRCTPFSFTLAPPLHVIIVAGESCQTKHHPEKHRQEAEWRGRGCRAGLVSRSRPECRSHSNGGGNCAVREMRKDR